MRANINMNDKKLDTIDSTMKNEVLIAIILKKAVKWGVNDNSLLLIHLIER